MSNTTAWTDWSTFDFTLTPQAKDVFDTVAPALYGAKYTALAFACDDLAAPHYCFLCDAQYLVSPPTSGNLVLIHIHLPAAGTPYHYRITPIVP